MPRASLPRAVSRHSLLAAGLAACLLLPGAALAAKAKVKVPPEKRKAAEAQSCDPLPPPKGEPWTAGERLSFEIDVMGASAGKLVMTALPTVGKGSSKEHVFRALAASNSFFSKVRRVRGRSTSFVRSKDMHPRRYEEQSHEGEVTRSAEVRFNRPNEGKLVTVDWERNGKKGKQNLRYANQAFDPVSAAFFLRTQEFRPGQSVCFDSYGIRKLWRVKGKVVGLEEVRVPAGVFKAWHLEGVAVRTDDPRSAREIHIWISDDERRLPVAALGVIDLGAVRAQLSHVGVGVGEGEDAILAELERPQPASPRPAPARPKVR